MGLPVPRARKRALFHRKCCRHWLHKTDKARLLGAAYPLAHAYDSLHPLGWIHSSLFSAEKPGRLYANRAPPRGFLQTSRQPVYLRFCPSAFGFLSVAGYGFLRILHSDPEEDVAQSVYWYCCGSTILLFALCGEGACRRNRRYAWLLLLLLSSRRNRQKSPSCIPDCRSSLSIG